MSVCVAKYHDQLISIRRHLHTMPEEGWSEFTTTNFIVEKLKEYGYKVLGNGTLTKKLTVRASAFSASAKEKIVAAGGKYEVV